MAGPGKGRRGASPKDVYKSLTSGSMVRIIKLVLKHYWIHLIFVLIGIILAAIASVKGTVLPLYSIGTEYRFDLTDIIADGFTLTSLVLMRY